MTAWYGWMAHALLFGGAIAWFARRGWLLPAASALALLPLGETGSIAALMHGMLGPPSGTLVIVVCAAGLRHALPTPPPAILATLLAAAAVFYAMCLGAGPMDPFALGYRNPWIVLALLPVAASLWRSRHQDWLMVISADCIIYALGLVDNLWTALLDPVLLIAAIARGASLFMQRHH